MNTKILSLTLCAVFMFSGYAIAQFENFNKARDETMKPINDKIEQIENDINKIHNKIEGKYRLIELNPQRKAELEKSIDELEKNIQSKEKEKSKKVNEGKIVKGEDKKAAFEIIKTKLVEKYHRLKGEAERKKSKSEKTEGQWKLTLEREAKKLELQAEELKKRIENAAKEIDWPKKKIEKLQQEFDPKSKEGKQHLIGEHLTPAKLISPPVAIAGGTIIGSVIGTDDTPVSDTYVSISTIHGTVKNVKTDENGRFKSKVPIGESILMLTAVGLKEKITRKIVPADDLDFPQSPPEFIEPGIEFTVEGNYPNSEYVVERYGESYLIPEARSVSKNGDVAITTLAVPSDIEPGIGKWIMTDAIGKMHKFKSCIYHVLRARIDQSRLESRQISEGEYELNFGRELANQKLWIKIEVTGAIKLLGPRGPRPFTTDANGHTIFRFRVRAKKVPPRTEIPFSISHTIYRSNR